MANLVNNVSSHYCFSYICVSAYVRMYMYLNLRTVTCTCVRQCNIGVTVLVLSLSLRNRFLITVSFEQIPERISEINEAVSQLLTIFGLPEDQTQYIRQFVSSVITGVAGIIHKMVEDICAGQTTGN